MARPTPQPATTARRGNALTPKQRRFVAEYITDLNATQAAIRAGYTTRRANQAGLQILTNPDVACAIAAAQAERAVRTQIEADQVLRRAWDIVTADPNELVQHRRVACRHCHGAGHGFQWIDEAEFKAALNRAMQQAGDALAAIEEAGLLPGDAGGYGYDDAADPHPGCPRCHGKGEGRVFIADTRKLTGPAKALFAGVRQSKGGIEVKMHDQMKALEMVARHLGMFNDKLTLRGDAENPIAVLLRQVQGSALKPVTR